MKCSMDVYRACFLKSLINMRNGHLPLKIPPKIRFQIWQFALNHYILQSYYFVKWCRKLELRGRQLRKKSSLGVEYVVEKVYYCCVHRAPFFIQDKLHSGAWDKYCTLPVFFPLSLFLISKVKESGRSMHLNIFLGHLPGGACPRRP